jgi:Uma2 family endonuclease
VRAERSGTLGGMALHPLSVDDYHRMIEAGVLTEDDRVELLDGVIVDMSPEGPDHSAVIARLNRFLVRGIDDPALLVRCQHPITLVPQSEPEPDLAVVDEAASTRSSHPAFAHLVVEVANKSLRVDRSRKARIYAAAGIPEYWIVDLRHPGVHVHLEPRDGAYRTLHTVEPPDPLRSASVELPELSLVDLFA